MADLQDQINELLDINKSNIEEGENLESEVNDSEVEVEDEDANKEEAIIEVEDDDSDDKKKDEEDIEVEDDPEDRIDEELEDGEKSEKLEEVEAEEEEGNKEGEVQETPTERKLRLENETLAKKVAELSKPSELEAPKPKTVQDIMNAIEEPEQIMESKEALARFILDLSDAITGASVERSLTMTPEVVSKFIAKSDQLKTIRDQFYQEHPELVEVQEYVAGIANEISAANPEMSTKEALDETAKRAYKALKIDASMREEEVKSTRKKPAFAKPKSANRKPKPKLSAMQMDIDDFLLD